MTNEELWERLEKQLSIQAPKLAASLRPGADEASLIDFERKIGQKLPEDIRFAYLRHDGCDDVGGYPVGLFGQQPWYSLNWCLDWWQNICEEAEGFTTASVCAFDETDERWNEVAVRPFDVAPKNWLPIGAKNGTVIFVDFLPGMTGKIGQIIRQPSNMGIAVLSQSFGGYLKDLVEALERNTIELMVQPGTVVEYWGDKKTKEDFMTKDHVWVYPGM
jgi:cell wall assembly regulator SMI1